MDKDPSISRSYTEKYISEKSLAFQQNSSSANSDKSQNLETQQYLYVKEGLLGNSDRRQQVKKNMIHPYNGVGKIIVTFKDPETKALIPGYATGFLISKEHVLTAAHAFQYHDKFLQPLSIRYYPEPLEKHNPFQKGIQAEILHLNKIYYSKSKIQSKLYDCAVLKLKSNSTIREQQVLKCNFQYSFDRNKNPKDLISIPGYPSHDERQNLKLKYKDAKNFLFYVEEPPHQQTGSGTLLYRHSTSKGTSGAPLLLKNSDHSYQVVGLHSGMQGGLNCGILLKKYDLRQTIQSLLKKQAYSPSPVMKSSLQKYPKDNSNIKKGDNCISNQMKQLNISQSAPQNSTQYIFAIDGSQQMILLWNQALEMLNQSIVNIGQVQQQQQNTVSVLIYNDKCSAIMVSEKPRKININEIDCPKGGRNFELVFQKAASIIRQTITKQLSRNIHFIFLMFGSANHPNQGIKQMLEIKKKLSQLKLQFHFSSISFRCGTCDPSVVATCQSKINEAMGGSESIAYPKRKSKKS